MAAGGVTLAGHVKSSDLRRCNLIAAETSGSLQAAECLLNVFDCVYDVLYIHTIHHHVGPAA